MKAVSRQTAWAAVRNVLTSFFSGSGRWPQFCGLIKRFKRFIKNSYKESKPSCVCTAGFAGNICCFPLIGKFVYP